MSPLPSLSSASEFDAKKWRPADIEGSAAFRIRSDDADVAFYRTPAKIFSQKKRNGVLMDPAFSAYIDPGMII